MNLYVLFSNIGVKLLFTVLRSFKPDLKHVTSPAEVFDFRLPKKKRNNLSIFYETMTNDFSTSDLIRTVTYGEYDTPNSIYEILLMLKSNHSFYNKLHNIPVHVSATCC